MALLLIEGFDHLNASSLPNKGWTTAVNFQSSSTTRWGVGQSLANANGNSSGISKALGINGSIMTMGFAFEAGNANGGSAIIAGFIQGGVAGSYVARIFLNSSTRVLSVQNSAGSTIATGTTPIVIGSWYYIELQIHVNGASGTCELHINGISEIPQTTGNFGSTNIDTVNLNDGGGWTTAGQVLWDDLYVCDNSGSNNNNFLGDIRISTIYPTSAGAHTQWTPDSGSNWQRVSEAQPDGDTSYVQDGTPGDIDTYTFGDVDTLAFPYGIQTNIYARKTDTNVREIIDVIRQGGVDSLGATRVLGSSYQVFSSIYNFDPSATNWTASNINVDEFGYKLLQ